jgi:threonyl-tRNA synthetase
MSEAPDHRALDHHAPDHRALDHRALDHRALDHRALGQRLRLFHQQEEAPGMVFWHPRGLALHRLLEEHARRQLRQDGYREVRTPQVMSRPLWERSGHWEHFREGMLVLEEGGRAHAVKPVSCPGHVQLAQRLAPSYRDLPLRLAEFGVVHRNEPSGALSGLFRLRQFTQDDGHVFCSEEQLEAEVARFCAVLRGFYAGFGFRQVAAAFSGRPAARAGDDALWDRAEGALRRAAGGAGLALREQPGEGAFYGPKLEFALEDRLGRAWQCGTLQLDLVMPERFDLGFVARGGERRRPVMLHRALYGSLERFLAVLLEHHGGQLPPWLAPLQVAVLPAGEGGEAWGAEVARELASRGLRAELDARDLPLSRRVAEAHETAVPFIVVAGARERPLGRVQLRGRGDEGPPRQLGLDAAAGWLLDVCRAPAPVVAEAG